MDGKVIAVHSRKSSSNTTQYFHYDALHSIEAITDHQGKVLERFRYTPFGERIATKGNDNVTTRGYTGHEHLAGIGLIHMNARVYDPVLQRFLSPDTIVQAPLDAQSYNRFAYVRNNPQKYTDPSGHSWWSENVTRRTSSSWNGLERAARRISNEFRRIGRDVRAELKRLCDSGCYVSAERNNGETRVSGGGGGGQVRPPAPGTSGQSSVGVSITINSRGQISSYSAYVGYGGANFGYTTGGDYSGGELFAEGLSGDRYSIYGFGRNRASRAQANEQGGQYVGPGLISIKRVSPEDLRSQEQSLFLGAQDGHSTVREANAYGRNANGAPLFVDASLLTVRLSGRTHASTGYLKGYVIGGDRLVHGQVSVAKTDEGYYLRPSYYDFEPHPRDWYPEGPIGTIEHWVRNKATEIALDSANTGGVGGAFVRFEIYYNGQPNVIE